MPIKSVCQSKVATIDKSSSLKEAAQAMFQQHVGSLVVTDTLNGKKVPSGMITDRDIALAIGSSQMPQQLSVEQVMHNQPLTVEEGEGIFETLSKMSSTGVKRVPVTKKDGSLCGVVCADDLLTLIGEEITNLAKITQTQIKREKAIRTPSEKYAQL